MKKKEFYISCGSRGGCSQIVSGLSVRIDYIREKLFFGIGHRRVEIVDVGLSPLALPAGVRADCEAYCDLSCRFPQHSKKIFSFFLVSNEAIRLRKLTPKIADSCSCTYRRQNRSC
jgi:hypothetical protein